jgi:hypothetical protein
LSDKEQQGVERRRRDVPVFNRTGHGADVGEIPPARQQVYVEADAVKESNKAL